MGVGGNIGLSSQSPHGSLGTGRASAVAGHRPALNTAEGSLAGPERSRRTTAPWLTRAWLRGTSNPTG